MMTTIARAPARGRSPHRDAGVEEIQQQLLEVEEKTNKVTKVRML